MGTRLFLNSLFEAPCATVDGLPSLNLATAAPAYTPVPDIEVSVVYVNASAATALDAELRSPLPANTTFVSASDGGIEQAGEVVWDLGNLGPDEGGERTFVITLGDYGLYDNTAILGYRVGLNEFVLPANVVQTLYDTDPPATDDGGSSSSDGSTDNGSTDNGSADGSTDNGSSDGVTGTDLMAHLVDLTPEPGPPRSEPVPFHPRRLPSSLRLMADAVVSRAMDPLRVFRSFGRAAASVGRLSQAVFGDDDAALMARPFDAPRTFFNHSLTPRRSVAFATAALEDCKFVKNVFGTTVNDVFLAACSQALRGYMAERGDVPRRPLLASVPVSVHGQTAETGAVNQVSDMFVRLPTDLADPVEQLRSVQL